MFKFNFAENDQTVYEIKTKSGRSYFVRAPGERTFDSDGNQRKGMLAFLVTNGNERTVALHDLDLIVSITPRPDIPAGKVRPKYMGDLFSVGQNQGCYSFLSVHLE